MWPSSGLAGTLHRFQAVQSISFMHEGRPYGLRSNKRRVLTMLLRIAKQQIGTADNANFSPQPTNQCLWECSVLVKPDNERSRLFLVLYSSNEKQI
jgi:hypothetical protein